MENSFLKQSLGNPARGNAFYQRDREIKKIFRALDANASIYLSAPRRVGKTSILKYLEDTQEGDDYYFIYTITESVYSINDFFKELYSATLKSKAVTRLSKVSSLLATALEELKKHVEEIPGGVKIKASEEPDYYEYFLSLLDKIEKNVGRVVIMVDEFPQALHNIQKEHGETEARRLLQLSRTVRHHKIAEEDVSFIYTGSISLFPMVEKIGSLADVNDLQPIEVKPLSRAEAADLLQKLSNGGKIDITAGAVNYLLDTVKCYIPFHLQLIYDELLDIYNEQPLTEAEVQVAIENTIDAKNKARFEPYFSRLEGLLTKPEYDFAMEVLKYVANNDSIDEAILYDTSVKHAIDNQKDITDMLCEDGYFFKSEAVYIYTSPILQLWCKKFN
jgi:hypothetical protein